MGMFDSIYITCPHCGKDIEYQTKAGECTLNSFYPQTEAIPTYILSSVFNDGDKIYCEFCGEPYLIRFDIPPITKVIVERI